MVLRLAASSRAGRFCAGNSLGYDTGAHSRRLHMSQGKYRRDRRIDDYIKSLPGWQQKICSQVRELVHAADPEVSEAIKRSKLPYFTLDGNICALLAAKDHVNIFIYDPLAPDPERIINQGQDNAAARAVQVYEGHAINKRALLNLFKAVIANNRAGGWRRLQRAGKSR